MAEINRNQLLAELKTRMNELYKEIAEVGNLYMSDRGYQGQYDTLQEEFAIVKQDRDDLETEIRQENMLKNPSFKTAKEYQSFIHDLEMEIKHLHDIDYPEDRIEGLQADYDYLLEEFNLRFPEKSENEYHSEIGKLHFKIEGLTNEIEALCDLEDEHEYYNAKPLIKKYTSEMKNIEKQIRMLEKERDEHYEH